MNQKIIPKRAHIPVSKVESSSIEAWGYDPAKKILQVNFKGPTPGGKPYQYDNVPIELVAELKEAESAGSFINKRVVRGDFKAHKLEPIL